jgi:signal transduction histidine kinase
MHKGRLPLHRVDVALPDLLQRSADAFRVAARESSVSLEVSAPPERACVDPVRVEQALTNLLDNALRHGRPRTIRVTAERDGRAVHIAVIDDGTGFPLELRGREFDPFARHGADADGERGAGLGLAIVRAIAEAHGGTSRIERSLGETRVELVLPG